MMTMEEAIIKKIREQVEKRETEVAELQAQIVEMEYNAIMKETEAGNV